MKTVVVFRLERNPEGYDNFFSMDCKFDIKNTNGPIYLEYDKRHIMGIYSNLRQENEVILADVKIFEDKKCVEHRFDYCIDAFIKDKNHKPDRGVTQVLVSGVSVIMKDKV